MAKAAPNEEVCGLIYHTLNAAQIYPCKNVLPENTADGYPAKSSDFLIHSDDYIRCMTLGNIVGVYHSHPNGPAAFSEPDLEAAEEYALPLYLYDVSSGAWLEYIPPSYRVPLEGRQFIWGFSDCYAGIRHYYRQNLGIHMGDYDRDETFENSDSTIILDNFAKEGFVRPPVKCELRQHDALLFVSRRANVQHFGVFIGNSRMFHHPLNCLSSIELIGPWTKRLHTVLRHKSLV